MTDTAALTVSRDEAARELRKLKPEELDQEKDQSVPGIHPQRQPGTGLSPARSSPNPHFVP
ncbi:hypothetical protein GCM10023063_42800 [Arthrobacter methylotrophus]|uniref:hypothetical protein n=1 Tax=Arthrobacter methylotrophus TaxID=121291 RepID=UPI0031E60DA3